MRPVMNTVEPDRLDRAYQTARAALLAERTPEGHWVGELSTSALSTAVAVCALALVQKNTSAYGSFDLLIGGGLRWLAEHQNADGGWGDTVKSFSNISTTMLCRAAFHLILPGAQRRAPTVAALGLVRRCRMRILARRALRPDAGGAGGGGARPLRQGSHVLRADPDDQRPRRPGVVERSAVAAVRAGVLSAGVVSLPAAAGRQLRAAGAHRHRPGGLSSSPAVEPDRAPGARAEPRPSRCRCWKRFSRPTAASSKRRR